jgi:hypothetical protein
VDENGVLCAVQGLLSAGLDVADLEGWLNDDDELEELSAVSITRLRIVARDAGIARRELSTVRL